MRAFAPTERFVAEVNSRKLRPAYVFVGDEAFFRRRCREAILQALVPLDLRDLALYEFDLAENELGEILDRARTPSLMAPFQVFFIRGVKSLFGRGSHDAEFEASSRGGCGDEVAWPHRLHALRRELGLGCYHLSRRGYAVGMATGSCRCSVASRPASGPSRDERTIHTSTA